VEKEPLEMGTGRWSYDPSGVAIGHRCARKSSEAWLARRVQSYRIGSEIVIEGLVFAEDHHHMLNQSCRRVLTCAVAIDGAMAGVSTIVLTVIEGNECISITSFSFAKPS